MEFNIKYTQMSCWLEEAAAGKVSINMDAVVPDSREDAARVIWTRGGVLLKGKEPAAHSCSFLGEAHASVLYQAESGALNVLRLNKEFSWSAETGDNDSDALPQVSWWPAAVEGTLLNPRKIAVNMDLRCQATGFSRGSLSLEPELSAGEELGIRFLTAVEEAAALREVKEKAFTLREQLPLEPEQRAPRAIEGEELLFLSLDSEQLGERCVVKGEAELRIWGLGEDGLPASCSFRIPFSQLIESGAGEYSQIEMDAQPSSLYLDWREGIDGQRSLDAEIHAVLQLRFFACVPLRAVTDAYSTRMPSTVRKERQCAIGAIRALSTVLQAEETLPLPDDVEELLAWEAAPGLLERDRESTGQNLTLSILVRRKDGETDGLTRTVRLQGDALPEALMLSESRLDACDLSLSEGKLLIRAQERLSGRLKETTEHFLVTSLVLEEESAWEVSELPTVSLVRRGDESLWDLAKAYRSSVEAIQAYNAEDSDLLLIPAL